ncbi:unnamed protein product [Effrenium voratum]|uniref:Uncharacterized protein n=1 Tax=Effrenium voratum TaxID=2562239 RepID=A0AA36I2T6_9DINO|nr:unnamed protein product [Effrenium voratum]
MEPVRLQRGLEALRALALAQPDTAHPPHVPQVAPNGAPCAPEAERAAQLQAALEDFGRHKARLRRLQRLRAQKQAELQRETLASEDSAQAVNEALAQAQQMLREISEPEELRVLRREVAHQAQELQTLAEVAARIIGMAQNGGLKMRPEVEMDDMPLNTELEAQQEKCIINDEGLMLLCGAKVLLCLSLPLVQLCVVVAAQVYLGESAWNAANLTFQERTWQHYMHSLSRFALERPLSLAWLYV